MSPALVRLVEQRAGGRCEYCLMPATLFGGAPFHVEHVTARVHGGQSVYENLALSCPDCNAYKGTNVAGVNPSTGRLIRLFHPRRDRWADHFRFEGPRVVGVTARGEVTVQVLQMNKPRMLALRSALMKEGSYPRTA